MSVVVEIDPLDAAHRVPHLAATVVQVEVAEITPLEKTTSVIVTMIEGIEIEIEIEIALEVPMIEIER
jgi:hypothetical protein